MSKLTGLVKVSCGAGAGAAILECMRALRLAKQHAACDILASEYDRIRAKAQQEGIDHANCFAGEAEADVIAGVLPKTWPFPKDAERALI